jgi:GDPmannose 4,6-dehydratase
VVRALITGITGQTGSYLAELLLQKGYEVHGLIRKSSTFPTERINHIYDRLKLHYFDLSDPLPLVDLLISLQPAEVYHLGAQSHVQVSFQLPLTTGLHTGIATATLLEAIRIAGLAGNCRFYQASSSEIFGDSPAPQSEVTKIAPRSPYAAAKAYAYYMTRIYREAYGIFAVNGILFNHESPRRSPTFVTRKITRGLARIKHGLEKELVLGNLAAERDWGFAGDYVDAIWRMVQHDAPDDWVVATGESHSVREFLTLAAGFLEIEDPLKYVRFDKRYIRPLEVPALCGDPRKVRTRLGWTHQTSFADLVLMMTKYDDEEARREGNIVHRVRRHRLDSRRPSD